MSFYSHKARKRFGQHWLKDKSVLENIVDAAELKKGDRVLEIGPGKGALTEKLISSEASLIHAIELDRDLIFGLQSRFSSIAKFSLKEGDALSDQLQLPDGLPATKVVANIPYNITGPLLFKLLGELIHPVENPYELVVLLLQKEVAERILAKPGEKSFSALSVRIKFLAISRSICVVSPKSFQPSPKVYSQVIVLRPFQGSERLDPLTASSLEKLLSIAFLSRRKMLRNTLKGLSCFEKIEALAKSEGISLQMRPQELSLSNWLFLARVFNRLKPTACEK